MMSRAMIGLAGTVAFGVITGVSVSAAPVVQPPQPAMSTQGATLVHYRGHGHYRPYGLYIAPPVYVAPYNGCSWLRHRARETGSRYWWRRYHDCIND